jgi:hypothetical protein
MAKAAIPNPLERRHLIERDAAPEQSRKLADLYLAEGRDWEAIAFLAKAGDREGLAALREAAMVAGDTFLVREVTRVLRDEVSAQAWHRVAQAATENGKDRFAAQAIRLAERAESRS